MDLNSLRQTVSNLTLYDVKAGVRKVQNAVMNYTDMEAMVREATNNEPWGASSTQMQKIADGTFNYQTLNEIMPMIYRRFTEKSAEEWRQIYKALQLLEYLIKHGSERVIDEARSHIALLKMLRQFHYIDPNGKDQGVNVRHRAKELAELLGDVERIRTERKKARAIKGKFVGVQGGSGMGSSSRFGGFGSNSDSYGGGGSSSTYGGFSGGVYGDGGGFGGEGGNSFGNTQARGEQFEEYDEFDEADKPASSASASKRVARDTTERAGVKKSTEPAKKKAGEVDLFSFDEPETSSAPAPALAPAPAAGSGLTSLSSAANDDDEFDDFQSAAPAPAQSSFAPLATAPTAATQFAAPKPVSAPQQANLSGMVAMSSISPPPSSSGTPAGNFSAFSTPLPAATQAPKPAGFQASTPNYFSSIQPTSAPQQSAAPSAFGASKPSGSSAAAKPAAGGDAFGSLWSQASVGIKKSTPSGPGPTIGQLAKEKSSAGIWGAPAPATSGTSSSASKPLGNGLDDLLG
ncbi:Epsin-3 [Cladorrhinum sp. PSN259]|nr:Epsin-3 [Cladorrhinum sp. PSN259]